MRSTDDQIVIRVGAEGGSLTLYRRPLADGREQFYVEKNQVLLFELIETLDAAQMAGEPVTQSRLASSFEDGLRLLDTEPDWFLLHPVAVHDELAMKVLAAVEQRLREHGVDEPRVARTLERWQRRCVVA